MTFPMVLQNLLWNLPALGFTAFCIMAAYSYWYMHFERKGRLLRKRFPSAPSVPILGTVPFFIGPPTTFPQKIHQWMNRPGTGRNLIIWLGRQPFLLIGESNAVLQAVLSSPRHIQKGQLYTSLKWIFGNGLVTSNGHLWKSDRKLLNPNFKYQTFDGFLECFNRCSQLLLKTLVKHEDSNFHVHPILARSTMDAISASVLGSETTFQADEDNQLIDATTSALELIRVRMRRPWLTQPILWKLLGYAQKESICKSLMDKYITPVIEGRREFLRQKTNVKDDSDSTMLLTDSLITVKTNEDINAHVLTIFGAGFETTASTMTYTLYLLGLHPEWQKRVQEEIDVVVGSEEYVTFAHLNELKTMEMCVKESMRVYPPVPMIARHIVEDINLDDGTVIPAGVDVGFIIREIHRNPEVFPEPHKFDPNRFLPENVAERNTYAFMPFSAGPRNCIGMRYAMIQVKTVLSHILRNFNVTTKQNPEDLKFTYTVIMEPEPAIEICFHKRR